MSRRKLQNWGGPIGTYENLQIKRSCSVLDRIHNAELAERGLDPFHILKDGRWLVPPDKRPPGWQKMKLWRPNGNRTEPTIRSTRRG